MVVIKITTIIGIEGRWITKTGRTIHTGTLATGESTGIAADIDGTAHQRTCPGSLVQHLRIAAQQPNNRTKNAWVRLVVHATVDVLCDLRKDTIDRKLFLLHFQDLLNIGSVGKLNECQSATLFSQADNFT